MIGSLMNKHLIGKTKGMRYFSKRPKMRRQRVFLVLSLVLSFVFCAGLPVSSIAHAQSSAQTALADELFDQGVALEKQGEVALACEKFEASRQLAPRPGTMYYLGACYEKAKRRASARAMFLEAADAAALIKDQAGATKARERADALLPVAKLVIVVKQPVDGLDVTIDGKSLGRTSWGTDLPVDSGKHVVRATAQGRLPWETTITVDNDAARVEVEIPLLAVETSELGGQRIAALAVGGVGVVGLALGGAFGIKAIVCKGDKTECSRSDFDTFATGSTVGFLVGGVAIAGATVLWLTAPSKKAKQQTGMHIVPVIGNGIAGGVVAGSF
jgi:hypothetical protein